MKNLISIITLTLIFSCCSKKDVQITTSTQLPQATQTGANTAGCLVNGQVFLPKGSSQAGPILSCFYQQDQDGYHMGLNIADKSNSSIKAVNISLNPAQLLDNVTYSLSEITNGTLNYASNFGEFIIYSNINSDNRFNTNLLNQGELKITKLNTQQKIISGTFWFDAVNTQGEIVKIREGRFDMRYVN